MFFEWPIDHILSDRMEMGVKSPVRLRLNSTAVHVEHDGDPKPSLGAGWLLTRILSYRTLDIAENAVYFSY